MLFPFSFPGRSVQHSVHPRAGEAPRGALHGLCPQAGPHAAGLRVPRGVQDGRADADLRRVRVAHPAPATSAVAISPAAAAFHHKLRCTSSGSGRVLVRRYHQLVLVEFDAARFYADAGFVIRRRFKFSSI